jgi:solute carrier family 35 protein
MLHLPSLVLYCCVSMFMVFGNKYLLNVWDFDCILLLVLTENVTNYLITSLVINFKRDKYATASGGPSTHRIIFKLFNIDSNEFLSSVFYCLNSIMSLKALDGLNIPIYTIFKRCVPLASLIISFFLFKKQTDTSSKTSLETPTNENQKSHSNKIILSILLMTMGVVVAGYGDIEFDLKSYIYCAFSVISQALYFSFIQKCGEHEKNPIQALNICSQISIPILISLFVLTGEFKAILENRTNFQFSNTRFLIAYLLVSFNGSLLVFSQFWCTINNNAVSLFLTLLY